MSGESIKTQYTETIEKVGGYYQFISCINRRIKELRNGSDPMVVPEPNEDLINLAVREIEAGHLHYTAGEFEIKEEQDIVI